MHHVVLAFRAQAALGPMIFQAGLVPAWGGWATVIWNVACLLVLSIVSRGNIYFPALHNVAPLLIGIALMAGGS
jgi:hypothetical protein